jgi:cobalt-zinc-cadmium efflux system outer membrane protein
VTLGRSELERYRAARDLEAAKAALAATWGARHVEFGRLEGTLADLGTMPSLEALDAQVERGPDLARWTTELEERGAAVALEKAARIPDVTVGAGGRHFSDNGDNALVVEFRVPLPVFDRNQGAIAEAQHRLEKARAERFAAQVSQRAAVAAAYAELAASYEQAAGLRDEVIPEAQKASEAARLAYGQGLFRLVEVLDAQRSLFELRASYVSALESFHVQAAEIERLTGHSATDRTEQAQ